MSMNHPDRTVYISGPMRGYPDLNFPAFHDAAARWRAAGWRVLSPAEDQPALTSPIDVFVRKDVEAVMSLQAGRDMVVVLPGWGLSRGAAAEVALARFREVKVVRDEDRSEVNFFLQEG